MWMAVLDTTEPTGVPAAPSTTLPAREDLTLGPRSLLVLCTTT
jgi:hypothetical protein